MKFHFPSFAILFFCMMFLTSANNCIKVETSNPYSPQPADTIVYKESNEDFANPERGFYRYAETHANNFVPVDINKMKTWRSLQQADNGQYKVYSTLVYR